MSNEHRYSLNGDYAKKIAVLSAIYRLIQMYAVAGKIAQDSDSWKMRTWSVYCDAKNNVPRIDFWLDGRIELVTKSDDKCEVTKFASLEKAFEDSKFHEYIGSELHVEYHDVTKGSCIIDQCLHGIAVVSHEFESIRTALIDGLFSQIYDLPWDRYKKGKK